MSARTSAMWLAMALVLSACGGDDGGAAGGGGAAGASGPAFTQASLPCAPGTMASCACLGGGTGVQSCLPGGQGYGPCTGCPPEPTAGDSSAAGSASSPPELDAGAADATAMTMDAGHADAGETPAEAGADGAVARLGIAPRGAAPGVSCGVGLPVLCELQTEKCCARSLRTDSCIGTADSCACDLPGCTVMEAHCDGPEDCPDGQVCCGTLSGGASYSRFECATGCDYDGTQRIACHQDDPQCPAGRSCENSQLLTNLQVCIDPATIQQ